MSWLLLYEKSLRSCKLTNRRHSDPDDRKGKSRVAVCENLADSQPIRSEGFSLPAIPTALIIHEFASGGFMDF